RQSQCACALLPNPCAEKAPNFEQCKCRRCSTLKRSREVGSSERMTFTTLMSRPAINVCGAAVPITSQGILIDDFHAACTTKLDHPTMLEVRQRTADCLDRQREVIGNVVARDWEDHQFGRAVGHSLCHFKKERADLFECSDPPHDDKLGLQSRDGLERRLAEFSC